MTSRVRAAMACCFGLLILGAVWAGPALAGTVLVMGAGKPGGNYYAFGKTFAEVVNASSAQTGISIQVAPSEGSVANLNGLASGKYQLGLAQADIALMAWRGQGPWARAGKQSELRSLCDVFNEGLTCVVSEAAGIKTCAGLKGKRVALGAEGSGTMVNALQALKLSRLKTSDLGQALFISPDQAMRLMYEGKLDAFFYMVGHPNPTMRKFLQYYDNACLIPLRPSAALKNESPFYSNYFILKKDYPHLGNPEVRISTIGINTFMMTTAEVSEQVVYQVSRQFMLNLPLLKKHLPFMRSTKSLSKSCRKLNTWNASAPYHPGFLKLFKEHKAQ